MSECQWNKTSRVQKHYKPFKITSCFYAAIRAVDKRGTCTYNVQPKPKFWPTWPNEYRSSAKLRPNISVLRHVFDNTLHTLQFHQNTTLQLYNVYKKLRHIKLFSNSCFRAELNNLTTRLCMVCYQDGVHLITVINFSISFGRWGGMSTELQPNISVLWQVFDNTLNTLQFHQNTTLQLHNVYKKLYAEKVSDTKSAVKIYLIIVLLQSIHILHRQWNHLSVGDNLAFKRCVGGQFQFIQEPYNILATDADCLLAFHLSCQCTTLKTTS